MSSRFPIPVVGLTGGIASGKSLAAEILREKAQIPVIDADQIARSLALPQGKAASAILHHFGTLDRPTLRKKIFSDKKARQELEAILHPLIREETLRQVGEMARAGATIVFYEASLLVETGAYRDFDGLLVIEAPLNVRLLRIQQRDGISAEAAEAIVRAQASDEQRQQAATWRLTNSGSAEALEIALKALIPYILDHVNTHP